MAYDPEKNYNKSARTIMYHENDGVNGNAIVRQRVLEGTSKTILWSIFDTTDRIFLGWSREIGAVNSEYTQDKTFSYDEIGANEMHLYAIWSKYKFGDDETMFTISNTTP